jgi:hypothetical protein
MAVNDWVSDPLLKQQIKAAYEEVTQRKPHGELASP